MPKQERKTFHGEHGKMMCQDGTDRTVTMLRRGYRWSEINATFSIFANDEDCKMDSIGRNIVVALMDDHMRITKYE
jgi:hypothetical protein